MGILAGNGVDSFLFLKIDVCQEMGTFSDKIERITSLFIVSLY